MSHRATVQTAFNNVEALRAACEALGVPFTENGEVRMYGGARERVPYMIPLDGPYDVGFTRRGEEDNFTVVCDSEVMHDWDNGRNNVARRVLGTKLSRLNQEYASARVALQQRMRGRSFNRVGMLDNGVLHVQVIGY